MIGRMLGPYRVLEKLGEGGMGEVYKAHDTQLQRDVALKVLPSEMALDPERLARFDREAQALAALNHPHIAQIYGFVDEGHVRAIRRRARARTRARRPVVWRSLATAVDCTRRVEALDPDRAPCLLGRLERHTGSQERAIRHMEEAVRRDPADSVSL